jgi:hypothetical protein
VHGCECGSMKGRLQLATEATSKRLARRHRNTARATGAIATAELAEARLATCGRVPCIS